MDMNEARLVHQLNRDFNLFISQWWREAFRDNFQKVMKARYTDYIAVGNEWSANYYAIEQDEEDIRQNSLQWLADHPDEYINGCNEFMRQGQETRRILKNFGHVNELDYESVKRLKTRYQLLFPWLRFSIRFPATWKKDIEKQVPKHAKRVIDTAYESRRSTDGIFEKINALFRTVFAKSLRETHHPEHWTKYFTEEDVYRFAKNESMDWPAIEARSKGYVLCRGKVYASSHYQSIFQEHGYAFQETPVNASENIRGTIAFADGKRTGIVRKLFAIEQLPSFQEGEILVSPMTVPDFLPAMKKAAAIVTDEGGVTCHAAIVARELGKPCIIGTKIASKILEDGERVEVDSAEGIIRRIA
ncbi:hypothetical protein KJ765_01050 [Candidatus Micrarchaeota archaeon]|nr:hypothetical protein [Candidatus Micrarchaeota archaeon]